MHVVVGFQGLSGCRQQGSSSAQESRFPTSHMQPQEVPPDYEWASQRCKGLTTLPSLSPSTRCPEHMPWYTQGSVCYRNPSVPSSAFPFLKGMSSAGELGTARGWVGYFWLLMSTHYIKTHVSEHLKFETVSNRSSEAVSRVRLDHMELPCLKVKQQFHTVPHRSRKGLRLPGLST